MKRLFVPTILVLAGLVATFWLFTTNITVSERNIDGVPAACGAAYDVVFLKKNGFMGGEVPSNQEAIDRACRHEARRDVTVGTLLGIALVTSGVVVYWRGRRPNGAGGAARHELASS